MTKIFVIHENDAWLPPLRRALRDRSLPFEEWHIAEGRVDLTHTAPDGVFYNRMSASSFTRGHRFAPELTSTVLAWLERQGRRVINTSRALQLEINKAVQYAALEAVGIETPHTVVTVGTRALVEAAAELAPAPVLLKPNRGGTGHGVQLFRSHDALRAHVESDGFEAPVDGITLVQQFIESPTGHITRAEFVGGRFLYAVRVETHGGFALCPADHCVDGIGRRGNHAPDFAITDEVDPNLVDRYERFLANNGIDIGAVEFVEDADGRAYTYDVNTNTNYNAEAEAADGRRGMSAVAEYLGRELAALTTRVPVETGATL